MIGRNDPCWCGSGKKWKKCHFPDLPKEQEQEKVRQKYLNFYNIRLKTLQEIEGIRKACKLTANILKATCEKAQEGVTTNELNDFAHRLHEEAGAIPAPLNYGSPPFPKSICTSLNEEVCHGIPNDTPLKEGDIMNIDISLRLGNYYGDCSAMVVIGKTTKERALVVEVSKECLERAAALLKPGLLVCDIANAIEPYAHKRGCSVVYQFVGHGVGLGLHEPPNIPHHSNEITIPLAPGMIFTIEPMINAGVAEAVIDTENKWTARTKDGKASAQWEHTYLITDVGYEILTLPD